MSSPLVCTGPETFSHLSPKTELVAARGIRLRWSEFRVPVANSPVLRLSSQSACVGPVKPAGLGGVWAPGACFWALRWDRLLGTAEGAVWSLVPTFSAL